jgi:hypothetical protein
VKAARTGNSSLTKRARLAERHRVRSICGPISKVALRSGMPLRAAISSLLAGGDRAAETVRSRRSESKKLPRIPWRSALRKSPW